MSDGYRYRIWCRDCCGEDFEGCFGGGSELSEAAYPTRAAAVDAAEARCNRNPWAYRIEPATRSGIEDGLLQDERVYERRSS